MQIVGVDLWLRNNLSTLVEKEVYYGKIEERVQTINEIPEYMFPEVAKKVAEDEKADKDAIEAAAKALTEAIMPIGAKMYEEAAKEEGSAEGEEAKSDEPVEGEIVDDKK